MKIILRTYSRSEEDDWKLNVQPLLSNLTESIDVRDHAGGLLGWKIVYRFS